VQLPIESPENLSGARKAKTMIRTMSTTRAFAVACMAIAIAVAGSPDARADEGPWTVQEIAGQVRVMPLGGVAVALKPGDLVNSGDEVETGSDGRLVLTRGEGRLRWRRRAA
jgi:fructose-1,6-bisphosphatase/inositol monophosphatase family enzyme